MKKLFLSLWIILTLFFLMSCDKDEEIPDDPVKVDCNSSNIVIETEATESSCGEAEGSIIATSTGGEGNIQYKLNEGSFQSSGNFTGLKPGTYTITARDAENCTATGTVTIHSGISFNNSIKPIIDTNCAISGCHVSGTGRADFTEFANIKQNAGNVKAFTQSKAMPKTGSLTDEEIEKIACWVDDGALNN